MNKLTPIEPESANIRILAQLVEYRRKMVQDRVDLSHRITATLKNYYPHVLDWFNEKDTLIFCHFVRQWPSLAEAKRARKQTLLSFFTQHHSRYPDVNKNRIRQIKEAIPLTEIDHINDEIKRSYKPLADRVILIASQKRGRN